VDRGQPVRLCGQHHRGEGACIIAHQLGIIPVTAVALAALPGGTATRTPPARILHSE
jgi:hypothetical protein